MMEAMRWSTIFSSEQVDLYTQPGVFHAIYFLHSLYICCLIFMGFLFKTGDVSGVSPLPGLFRPALAGIYTALPEAVIVMFLVMIPYVSIFLAVRSGNVEGIRSTSSCTHAV